MPDVSILNVLLHGRPIGTLTRFAGDRTLFAFNEAHLGDEARPVLSLGFKDAFGGLIADFAPTQTKLLPFFSNLLPEGHMRTYLAERAGVNPEREFFLLRVLGRDLPGAVMALPADGEAPPQDVRGDRDRGPDERPEAAFHFSLAGVQLKFSAVNEAAGGLAIPARGVGGDWIVKLPSREFSGVPENEFAMMTLAKSIGIDVPEVRLVDVAAIDNLPEGAARVGGKALAVRRFDRPAAAAAMHMEDFAQVFGVYPDEKYRKGSYRHIAAVIAAEGSDVDVAEFIRRLTFNVLIGNADMHLKNLSLIYPDRRHASLAPAYDLISTIAYIPTRDAALKFSRTRRFDAFTADELAHLAAKARLPERLVLETARETVAAFHRKWAEAKANLPLAKAVVEAIEIHLRTLPIS